MANLRDRVKAATATTGTGTVTLGAAATGYRTFASAYSADRVITYAIEDGAAWETGTGTYSASGNTLTRTMDASSTGSLLNLSGNATVSVAFLSRENVTDWPFLKVKRLSGTGGTDGSFVQITYDTLVTDTAGGWNSSTNIYTIMQAGVYDITSKFRISDGDRTGKSYGLGVDTSRADSPDFTWFQGAPNRQGATYLRRDYFASGAQLQAFYYMDGIGAGYFQADLSIARIR